MDLVNTFQCYECGKGFEQEVFLFLHQYSTHDKTPFKCDECGESGVGQQKLYNHMKNHREEKLKIYKCHLCPFEEQNLITFKEHAELHTVEPEKKAKHCDPCGKEFVSEENYFDHYIKAHVQETDQCDFKFTRNNLLMESKVPEHVENGDGTIAETLISEVPNISHRSILETLAILKSDDQDKELITEKSQQIQCEKCHNYMVKSSLLRHMKTFHGWKGKKWDCKDCGKFLQSESRLRQHQLKHMLNDSPNEGFFCPMCKYVTTCKEYLNDHKRRAHIETTGSWVCKMGKCTEKPKSYINHLLLIKHQQDHKNTACPECGKIFGAKRNMKRHIETNICRKRKQQQIA